jgi:hypothetical protein
MCLILILIVYVCLSFTFENFWQLSISQRFAIKRIGHIAAAFGGSSE